MKLVWFKLGKPRQFNYIPRFYDPEKDRREQRRKELLGEDVESPAGGKYVPGDYIRKNMRSRLESGKGLKKNKYRMSITRSILLLILMGLAAWWMLS